MRTVLINHLTPFPNQITGLTIYTWNIVRHLLSIGGYNYILATPWDIDKIPSDIIDNPLLTHLKRPHRANYTKALLLNTIELPTICRARQAEIVFSPQPYGTLAGGKWRVSVIHDLYVNSNPELFTRRRRLQWNMAMPLIFWRADKVIAVSEYTANLATMHFPQTRNKIQVIHEAPSITLDGSGRAIRLDCPYVLVVANVTANKNIESIFEAMHLVSVMTGNAALRLVLVGRDDSGGLLKQTIAKYRGVKFSQVSGLTDTQLCEYYQGAICYLNTSLVEGFCLPILEAQHFGIPIVCSDIPVLREVAGDSPTYVHPTDSRSIAKAIAEIWQLDTDSRSARGNRGRENAAKFSWLKAAQQTKQVFDALA